MIGIVLLNYNQWDLTIECVKSIQSTCRTKYRIYLVDNNSIKKETDKFLDFYSKNKDIILLKQTINKGYSAGNNAGIKAAIDDDCEFVLISNNDVIFKEGCIDNMCSFLGNNPNYGIVGPKIMTIDGKLQELNLCCKMTLSGKYKYVLRKTPLRFISRKFVADFHKEESQLKDSFDVYAVSGCCFLMSRAATHVLYPFDENTFLYEEENIIGVRMERQGLKTKYFVNSEIIHLGGKSTNGLTTFGYSCLVESEIYYCRKYLGSIRLQVIPLYLFRTCAYIGYYRFRDIKKYFDRTLKMLQKKIV